MPERSDVPEELREMIEQAMIDARAANPTLTWRCILDRIEIETRPAPAGGK